MSDTHSKSGEAPDPDKYTPTDINSRVFLQATKPPGLFSWVVPALATPRTLKTWIRCCLALGATMILLVGDKSLTSMGQAAFFSSIVAVMLPPSIALSLFVLASVTLAFGMLVGWAWSAAAMAAGLSVRDQALLARQEQKAQALVADGIPLQRLVFQGLFLDPGTSAVYGAFFFIGTFVFGTLRAFLPKLTLFSIFGSIILDIMCSYGPLFPTAQYTLAKLFLIPTAYYLAIALTTLVLVFPVSLNHVWIASLENNFVAPLVQVLSFQDTALETRPSDQKKWFILTEKAYASRQKLLAGTHTLLDQTNMIDVELSVGRLGPSDLKRISGELKSLMFRAAGLHVFLNFVHRSNISRAAEGKAESYEDDKSGYWDRHTILLKQIRESEAQHGHDLDSLVPILASSSRDLRTACGAAVAGMGQWLHGCNTGRWARFFSKYDKDYGEKRHTTLVNQLSTLREALEYYRETEKVQLIKPFEKFFDPVTGVRLRSASDDKGDVFSARSLYICFVFSFTLEAFAERLAVIMSTLVDLDGKRPKPRIWAPTGFGKLGRKLMSKRDVDRQVMPLSMGTTQDPTAFDTHDNNEDEEENEAPEIYKEKKARRNPDALPPKSAFGRSFLKLGTFFRFFKSAEGIFALRHAVVSLALWIPSICPSTAWFYYGNRGIWALIMAQTGLAVYAGDQIAGFFIRILGTISGLLVGMVVWYIGAGLGNGNPYGIVVATTVFTSPFLLGRLAAPPQQMMYWAMGGVTIVLVVGYSWVDRHLLVLVNAGVGVAIGWRRALLVIIGFTAGFIVMMFPRPTSSRTLVRQTLAATVGELGHILATEIEALLAEENRARSSSDDGAKFTGNHSTQKVSQKEERVRRIGIRALTVATRIQSVAPSLKTAQLEPQLQGTWPHAKYASLYDTQMKLLASLMLFTGAFTQLDTKWCSILVHQTPFLNPNLLSDIFAKISILSYALAGGHPLPPSLPKLRDRLVYHERLAPPNPTSSFISDEGEKNMPELDFVGGKLDDFSIGFDEVTLDILRDKQLPSHATALVALSSIIILVDEISIIIRDLCGELTFEGFYEFHREFLGKEEKAIGAGYSRRIRPR